MFDKSARRSATGPDEGSKDRAAPEDERIALRCNRRELQLLDSFVANGEFRSRSELMRKALLDFLRLRAMTAVTTPVAPSEDGLVEVSVRLRPEEVEAFATYARLVGNGRSIPDVLAEAVRQGEIALKISELAARHRTLAREAAETRAALGSLKRSAEDLERRGVVGR